jgi:peptidoglycan/LPS O-acetylase OafA/YrhL
MNQPVVYLQDPPATLIVLLFALAFVCAAYTYSYFSHPSQRKLLRKPKLLIRSNSYTP